MIEEVYAKVAPQVTEQFKSKFDIQAAADPAVPGNAPASVGDFGQLAAIYPDEVELPPSDVPPEHNDE